MAKNDKPITIDESEIKMPEQQFGMFAKELHHGPSLKVTLALLIGLLVLILVGLFLWGETLKETTPSIPNTSVRPTAEENDEPESNNAEADTQVLETVSNSDELAAIEADIGSTNLDTLDAEFNAIDAELEAALQ